MTVLYKLAKGQLSQQYHYDFGLRALKAVLVMAGELKRGSPDLSEVGNAVNVVAGRSSRLLNIRVAGRFSSVTYETGVFTGVRDPGGWGH